MMIPRRSGGGENSLILVEALLIVVSLSIVVSAELGYIAGDPLVYVARMDEVVGGGIPYLEVPFEHFPFMLLPMAMAWAIGGFVSAQAFRVVWVMLTSVVILLIARTMMAIGRHLGDELLARWVIVSAPLLPLVVFRTEPWVVLIAVWSVQSMIAQRPGRSVVLSTLGVFAKGWPAVLNLGLWVRGWRKAATGGFVMASLVLGLMLLLPGFMRARWFEGLHSESTGGAIWLLLGSIYDWRVELMSDAGAMYVNAPSYLVLPGILGGVAIGLKASTRLRRHRDDVRAVLSLLGAFVAAFLLLSPLQSSQFIYWLIPFIVLGSKSNTTHVLALLLGLLATLSTAGFGLLQDLNIWWILMVAIRHGLIAAVGWRLAGADLVVKSRGSSASHGYVSKA